MNSNAKNKRNFFCKLLLICLLFPLALPYPVSALDADTYEEDNSASQAKLFTLNDVQKHSFHDASDEDWVMFNATSEESYQIEVTNAEINCYAEITLYDKDGQTAIEPNKEVKGKNVVAQWKCPKYAGGSYYVSLKNYEPANNLTAYDLNIFPIDIYEDDNNRYQAKLILTNTGVPQHHNFHKSDDKDWIMFHATANKSYTIKITDIGKDCNPQINLYTATNVIEWTDFDSDNNKSISYSFEADGYYYVEIINIATNLGNSTWYDISVSRDVGPEFPGAIIGIAFDVSRFPRKPIVGAKIQINGRSSDPIRSSNGRDANGIYYPGLVGYYIIPQINAGDYTITATARDYESYQATVSVYEADITEHIINMIPVRPREYICCVDNDSDGRGDWKTKTYLMNGDEDNPSATLLPPYVENCDDCDDDSKPSVYLGAPEICSNGIDENCDGVTDDKFVYYPDNDGDRYGDAKADSIESCMFPSGYALINVDCDDKDRSVNPYAPEICGNSKDDDCDGKTDEEDCILTTTTTTTVASTTTTHPTTTSTVIGLTVFYYDADGDGYGDPNRTTLNIAPPVGYVSNNLDCYDSWSWGLGTRIHPGAPEVCDNLDNNCDGNIDEGCIVYYKDADDDKYSDGTSQKSLTRPDGYKSASELTAISGDCNDDDPAINPGSAEICNAKDDNCNGKIDEGVMTAFYRDADADGYGNPHDKKEDCEQPEGYVRDNTDCNDSDQYEHPEQRWFKDKDEDGYSDGSPFITSCLKPEEKYIPFEEVICMIEGYNDLPFEELTNKIQKDCDDDDPKVDPGVEEICCNGKDDNCDGYQEPCLTYCKDADGDGYGSPNDSIQDCSPPYDSYVDVQFCNDCDDTNSEINPGVIECDKEHNEIDDDCDGKVDEDFEIYYQDSDKDGHGNPEVFEYFCTQPDGYVKNSTDCNDADPKIHPDAKDVCDGKDNNCNEKVDEDIFLFDAISILNVLTDACCSDLTDVQSSSVKIVKSENNTDGECCLNIYGYEKAELNNVICILQKLADLR